MASQTSSARSSPWTRTRPAARRRRARPATSSRSSSVSRRSCSARWSRACEPPASGARARLLGKRKSPRSRRHLPSRLPPRSRRRHRSRPSRNGPKSPTNKSRKRNHGGATERRIESSHERGCGTTRPRSRVEEDALNEQPAVVARGLRKRYGDLEAVAGIDFEAEARACYGFLGPNGAGKTTTMRMIACAMPPSGGQLDVLGLPVVGNERKIKARLGIVPQEDNLDEQITVVENLTTYARYFGIKARAILPRIDELLEFMQ